MIGFNNVGLPGRDGAAAGFMSGPPKSTEVREFRQWADFVNANFPWLEHRKHGDGRFGAHVSAWRFSGGTLATINASASEVIRTRQLADRAETGQIKLLWQLAGRMEVEQDGRGAVVEAGQTVAFDTTRPYRCRLHDGAHFAVLMLPHAMCPGWKRISQTLCGRTLGERTTLRAAFGALMALDGASGDDLDAGDTTLINAVQTLITRSLHHCASELGVHADHNPRLRRAERYILEHLADPDLDPEHLATALCMSRRSLYMLFKEHALTPLKLIHDIRLERSRIALDDPNNQQRKITDIAFDHGFNDYATFSRLFKTQFGLTPSEFRQRNRVTVRLDA